jgi:integrase
MPRKTLRDKGVEALKPRAKLYLHPDPELVGHYVRVMPSGSKSYVVVTRDRNKKQKWITLGSVQLKPVDAARNEARDIINRIHDGIDPEGPPTFDKVVSQWLELHVDATGLRSQGEIRRLLKSHMLPAWTGREFESIRRGDVAALLDRVQKESGARTADYVLAIISKMANWYEGRNEDYVSPVVKSMKRYSGKEHARSRILTDDEIRELWKADGEYGSFTKLLLLTAQRYAKVNGIRWEDIKDDVWTVPQGPREKATGGSLKLPQMALDLIDRQPHLASDPYVFRTRQFTNPKGTPWVLHDLRRTARSLMSRAGVQPHIAERVLGHVQPGVSGVYDRHQYDVKKGHALALLAGLLANILRPESNVVPLRA